MVVDAVIVDGGKSIALVDLIAIVVAKVVVEEGLVVFTEVGRVDVVVSVVFVVVVEIVEGVVVVVVDVLR